MKVRPKENYKLYCTRIKISKDKIYDAVIATNQPNYKEEGKIFVDEILLTKDEYDIVPDNPEPKKRLSKTDIAHLLIDNPDYQGNVCDIIIHFLNADELNFTSWQAWFEGKSM